jgi:hypothetical protein
MCRTEDRREIKTMPHRRRDARKSVYAVESRLIRPPVPLLYAVACRLVCNANPTIQIARALLLPKDRRYTQPSRACTQCYTLPLPATSGDALDDRQACSLSSRSHQVDHLGQIPLARLGMSYTIGHLLLSRLHARFEGG